MGRSIATSTEGCVQRRLWPVSWFWFLLSVHFWFWFPIRFDHDVPLLCHHSKSTYTLMYMISQGLLHYYSSQTIHHRLQLWIPRNMECTTNDVNNYTTPYSCFVLVVDTLKPCMFLAGIGRAFFNVCDVYRCIATDTITNTLDNMITHV